MSRVRFCAGGMLAERTAVKKESIDSWERGGWELATPIEMLWGGERDMDWLCSHSDAASCVAVRAIARICRSQERRALAGGSPRPQDFSDAIESHVHSLGDPGLAKVLFRALQAEFSRMQLRAAPAPLLSPAVLEDAQFAVRLLCRHRSAPRWILRWSLPRLTRCRPRCCRRWAGRR